MLPAVFLQLIAGIVRKDGGSSDGGALPVPATSPSSVIPVDTTTSSLQSTHDQHLSGIAIAGIIVAIFVILSACGIAFICYRRRGRIIGYDQTNVHDLKVLAPSRHVLNHGYVQLSDDAGSVSSNSRLGNTAGGITSPQELPSSLASTATTTTTAAVATAAVASTVPPPAKRKVTITRLKSSSASTNAKVVPVISNRDGERPVSMTGPGVSAVKMEYTASKVDELTLEVGEFIQLLEVFDDGWAKGRILRNDQVGLFPLRCLDS
ncbi:hypothetical protein BDR26DRAFT_513999 [Obelidium mucronatum]|nr:hypothetical protein BDR26DRAFT_513999 [Obelidium mucronatum]